MTGYPLVGLFDFSPPNNIQSESEIRAHFCAYAENMRLLLTHAVVFKYTGYPVYG